MTRTADGLSGTVGKYQSRTIVFSLICWLDGYARPGLGHGGSRLIERLFAGVLQAVSAQPMIGWGRNGDDGDDVSHDNM
eukprot:COSAG01_NODE_1553_length_9931_cov_3.092657_7_plen_79_part_00